MLFNKKKKLTWLPAAALILAAGIGYGFACRAGTAEPQSFRLTGTGTTEKAAGSAVMSEAAGSAAMSEAARNTAMSEAAGRALTEKTAGEGKLPGDRTETADRADSPGNRTVAADGADQQGDQADSDRQEEDTAGLVWVHVCGSVCYEGVYGLPEGSRVQDAVTAAGGFSEDADRSSLNLAAVLIDATKVYVPSEGEASLSEAPQGEDPYSSGRDAYTGYGKSARAGSKSGSGGSDAALVDINRASVQELMSLPGIGQAKAEAIVAYREEHGFFGRPEELKKVSGIGDGIYKKLESKISV